MERQPTETERSYGENLLEYPAREPKPEVLGSEQFHLVLAAAGVAAWAMDNNWHREFMAPRFHETMFEDLPGNRDTGWEWWTQHLHPDERADIIDSLRKALDDGSDRWAVNYRFRKTANTYHWFSDIALITRDGTGKWQRVTGAMIDINQRRMAAILAHTVHDLSEHIELQSRMGEIASWERETIGRELHDNLGQRLTGLRMLAMHLQSQLPGLSRPHLKMLEDIVEQLKEAAVEVSCISRGLAPMSVSPEGLANALAMLVERSNCSSTLQCRFYSKPGIVVDDYNVAHQVYRIAQEALSNALKYANAKTITVSLANSGPDVELRIADDGVGFDVSDKTRRCGIGLRIMRHRANTIGAEFNVNSTPGRGTCITCTFPGSAIT